MSNTCYSIESEYDITKQSYNNSQEELNDLRDILKTEQCKNIDYNIIYDLIWDVISEENFDPLLKSKIEHIIINENLKQSLSLDNLESNQKKNSVLGVGVVKENLELTYSEDEQLQEALKSKLSEDSKNLLLSHPSWCELMKPRYVNPIDLSSHDKTLIEYKEKLIKEHQKYLQNLSELHKILEDITNIRVNELPKKIDDRLKYCELERKINHFKCNLSENKCRVDIFTETKNSLRAYKELISDIEEQQKMYQKEVEELKDLKEKYNQISGKEFDEILQPYLRHKAALERKKMFYSKINN